jgi:hypothetical protein
MGLITAIYRHGAHHHCWAHGIPAWDMRALVGDGWVRAREGVYEVGEGGVRDG